MGLVVGEVFRPWRHFPGVMIYDPVLKSGLSPGAKLCYGVLARFQGKDRESFPSMRKIGEWTRVSVRQASTYVGELERNGYIRRRRRGRNQSNHYVFLWHSDFDGATKRKDSSAQTGSGLPPIRITDGELLDPDCSPSNRKERDSTASQFPEAQPRQYPALRQTLRDYMGRDPSSRQVVDVMDAAGGATESEVIKCLRYLHSERGLACGKRNGPKSFAWFKTTVQDYFENRRNRAEVSTPCGYGEWMDRNEVREMTAPFDSTSD